MIRILSIIIIGLLALAAGLFLHWMATFLVVFLSTYIRKPSISSAVIMGLVSLFVVWFSLAMFLDVRNDHLLSRQIGQLFGGVSGLLLALVTGLIGGIGGALSGWLGASMRKK